MASPIPAGFRLAGVYCGIKTKANKLDLTLVLCDQDATAAGVYTTNQVCAAPVIVDRSRTPSGTMRAVVTNSGCANACTGSQGMANALQMARLAAQATGVAAEQVLVMSTGIIGEHLSMEKIEKGVKQATAELRNDQASLDNAAAGFMTTDLVPKVASRSITIKNKSITITGIAKGSGMIGPNMATMLGLVMTDAKLTPAVAQAALSTATKGSFNRVTVDGHTSTNDTVILLASGASGAEPSGSDLSKFQNALDEVCIDLAKMVAKDGEGATHLVQVDIRGCKTEGDANAIGQAIANSPLVKTAIAGADPNWGRIVSAAGYAGPKFDPDKVSLLVNGALLYQHGTPVQFDAEAVSTSIKNNHDTFIQLTLGEGSAQATLWTCDLTHDYITINADYHT